MRRCSGSQNNVTDVAQTALNSGGIHQQTRHVFDPEVDRQPVQFKQCWLNMVVWLQIEYKYGRSILDPQALQ